MKSANWERIKDVFHRVLAASEDSRLGLLREACGDDEELRGQIEVLLAAHEEADAEGELGAHSELLFGRPSETTGARIGPYKLVQEIGEGGFGVVYMAEQETPVRRRVALKIIKPGMDSKQVIARFEAERQALAMMDHPNIARVFDAGTTESERPYFVMELVKGVPITEYCDANNLDHRARLQLFTEVCGAVQHAHQKGIIHRDIKPSNVLVTLYDDRPVPKVIDFGIAKATHQRLTEKTMFTEFRQLIGTPAYMSPEQAGISGLDVDTRSDIYALGVLLYELLTGTPPFDPTSMRGVAYDEMLRVIREVEPPKPSIRVSTLGDSLTEAAKHRGTETAGLSRAMRGDLDWIVMRALEKDRTRRYDTANDLARDVQRHLGDEPVLAGPPSAWYRMRKFARRNRVAVTWGGLAAAGVLIGLALATVGLVRADHERRRAVEAESVARGEADRAHGAELAAQAEAQRAIDAREDERKQRELTREEADRAAAVLGFLEQTLASADPLVAGGGEVSLATLLDGATRRLDAGELSAQSLVEARVRSTLGRAYLNLHLSGFETAERHLRRASEIWLEHSEATAADAVRGLLDLAELHDQQDDDVAAGELYGRALDVADARKGEDPATVGDVLTAKARFLTRCGAESPKAFEQAEELFREALDVAERLHGSDHASVAARMNDLADVLIARGELEEAEFLLKTTLEMQHELHGEEHPVMGGTLSRFGHLEWARDNEEAAERYLRDALAMRRTAGWEGGAEGDFADDLIALAQLLTECGRFAEAEAVYRELLELAEDIFPEGHPTFAFSLRMLAEGLQHKGDLHGAEQALLEALQVSREALGDEHQETIITVLQLGSLYFELERFDDAEPLILEGCRGIDHQPDAPDSERRTCFTRLADTYRALGRTDDEAVWRARASELAKR